MMGHVLLGIWLIPAIIAFPTFLIAMMIQEGSLFPFDEWFEIFILIIGVLIWPVLLVMGFIEYRDQRKKKLAEVQETIEYHYKDKWFE